jgi:hypothetical protein
MGAALASHLECRGSDGSAVSTRARGPNRACGALDGATKERKHSRRDFVMSVLEGNHCGNHYPSLSVVVARLEGSG